MRESDHCRAGQAKCDTMRVLAHRQIPTSLAIVTGLVLAVLLALLGAAPAFAQSAQPNQPTHAYPVSEDPPPHALLQAPPSGVTITFSEDVNPATSRLVVVDTTNREVDNRDAQVSSSNAHIFSVTLPLLPAGTYVVVWKVQSADDGHVTGGSYYYQIARPDGTAPPIPTTLPTGAIPGAGGGTAEGTALDLPTVVQAIGTWLALLFMTFWAGGVIWETWILPPGKPDLDPDLAAAATLSARRFRRLAAPALMIVLLADVVFVMGQAIALAGDWTGLFSAPLLRAILFGSRFGLFWWARELVALLALVLLVVATRNNQPFARPRRGVLRTPAAPPATEDFDGASTGVDGANGASVIPDWRRELLHTLEGIQHLPRRLADGWRTRTAIGQIELVLVVFLLLAFALSGHASAVPANIFIPAIAVDLLHLMGDVAWLGGLFYIAVVFIPSLAKLPLGQRARVLALGLPAFGALAIVSATMLAATGSLNATIRMSSVAQFFTTAYGRTLAIKIELFLIMVAISAYHAFWLRPRLSRALLASTATQTDERVAGASVQEAPTEGALVKASGMSSPSGASPSAPHSIPLPSTLAMKAMDGNAAPRKQTPSGGGRDGGDVATLASRLEGWLRREALLGAGVLVCVALLAAYAGTLAAPVGGGSSLTSAASGSYISAPQQAGSYTVVLKVTPATFGTNTFVVTVKDAQGNPVTGAAVLVQTTMLDMDMGTQNVNLTPMSGTPGSYSAQGDLDMGGNWGVVVKVLPQGASDYLSTSFKFVIGY